MPVTFLKISLTTDFPAGSDIRVCGNHHSFGSWDVAKAPRLVPLLVSFANASGDGVVERSVLSATIELGTGIDAFSAPIEYKLVIQLPQNESDTTSSVSIPGTEQKLQWQDGPNHLIDFLSSASSTTETEDRVLTAQIQWYTKRNGSSVVDGGAPLGAPGLEGDPWLEQNTEHLISRYSAFKSALAILEAQPGGLDGFSRGYERMGFTRGFERAPNGEDTRRSGIWYREWAPGARAACLMGDFNGWKGCGEPGYEKTAMTKDSFGTFSLFLPDKEGGVEAIAHDSYIKLSLVLGDGTTATRIPTYIRRAVYDEKLNEYVGKYWNPPASAKHAWTHTRTRTLQAANASFPNKVSWGPLAGTPPLPIPSLSNWIGSTASRTPESEASNKSVDPASSGLRIYEAHIGMASAEEKVGSYREFADNILPRIKKLGYNCVQLMAVMEHAYYGSFGYHVNQFLAPSSRFGTPEDLKFLVDAAHGLGLLVIMDCIHSHANKNINDGINFFDGTDFQYFHAGEKGNHSLWDSRLFDYSKLETQRLLLSSLRLFSEEFRFDGFRFDGVTSMMYDHHGLSFGFTGDYKEYFGSSTDMSAVVFLMLANHLLHSLEVPCISIAEDVSGMPTLCRPVWEGGVGFDFRLGMAVPDMWIKLLKEVGDNDWPLETIVWTLVNRRWQEKTITYCESHDQALVGDKTIAFWLMDADMYWHMISPRSNLPSPKIGATSMDAACISDSDNSPRASASTAAKGSALNVGTSIERPEHMHVTIDRGIALHKLIRLITFSLGGEGYLNFMGNEFGHPEWVDFPRVGNGWSYKYCRRQWNLVDNPDLLYFKLNAFDAAMHALEQRFPWLQSRDVFISTKNQGDHVLAYDRGTINGPLVFIVNLNTSTSFTDYKIGVPCPGEWEVALDSDAKEFGGHGRVKANSTYLTTQGDWNGREQSILVYSPCRTILVLKLKESGK